LVRFLLAGKKGAGTHVDFGSADSTKYQRENSAVLHITPWERHTLELLASGMATNELARRLEVRESEMEARLITLFARMGAASPADAVASASRRGLLAAQR
jgi:DNA-binding NarL/FixJ family response regulator